MVKQLHNQRLRILFLGNSYTSFHSLPRRFRRLAQLDHKVVFVDYNTVDGALLIEHLEQNSRVSVKQFNQENLYNVSYEEFINTQNTHLTKSLKTLTNSNWDYVILQEQSQIPANETQRTTLMYPAIRKLDHLIKKQKAKTLLFLTWGDKQANLRTGSHGDFYEMLKDLEIGYQTISREIGAQIVPAGIAWRNALQKYKHLELWDIDGQHPSLIGQHLNMYLFYIIIFHEKPLIMYHSPLLTEDLAKNLVEIAWKTYKSYT